jgi:hypothetical protein
LPDLIFRLRQKKFTGFIDVDLQAHEDSAILFFHQGERKGGSYSWGRGGLSPSDDDYNRLLGLLQTNAAIYAIGHFKKEAEPETVQVDVHQEQEEDGPQYFSNLETAMEEFLGLFIQVTQKKIKGGAMVQLRQQFLDSLDTYPVLDPFNNFYTLADKGTVSFGAGAPKEEIAAAIVDCVWQSVEGLKLQKKFRVAIKKWAYKSALEERGIEVDR